MASSKDSNAESSLTGYGDEDIRGDGKKKKFKPLSAVKKFFTKKRDKKDTVIAVKAKSTTALHSGSGYRTDDDDEDDDDGGFRNHPKPLTLATTRSLSEDSVFSPEQRGTSIVSFPKSAVSDERLPVSAFQSELLSKLNKRRSQYSDDYQDEGLPRSPVPPVTTADVIMSGPLKKLAGPSGKSSSIRDSDQSLISVDSSENEEELFFTEWKSSVPSRKSGASSSGTSDSTMDTFDLNSIQKTDLLVSRAAKDKIMVKPQRKTVRQSRKRRETSSPMASLPSLNEESPTKSKPDDVKGSWIPGSPAKSPEKVVISDAKPSTSGLSSQEPLSPAEVKTGPTISIKSKPKLSSITISKGNNSASPLTSPSSLPPVGLSTIVMSAAVPPPKVTTPTTPSTNFELLKNDKISNPENQSQSASSPSVYAVSDVVDIASNSNVHGKRIENLSVSERGDKTILPSITDASSTRLSQSQRELNEYKPSMDIKSRMSQFQMSSSTSDKYSSSSSGATDDFPINITDSDSLLASAKDEYKTRRQERSRTLPSVIAEQSPPTVQRSGSYRIHNTSGFVETQEQQPSEPSHENVHSLLTSTTSTSLSSDIKKPDNVKLTPMDSTVIPAGEPSWFSIVRKRKAEQEINVEIEKTQTTETAVPKSGVSTQAPKSVFTSASYLEKKRGSFETVSFKNRDLSDQDVKMTDSAEVKLQSIDRNLQSKYPNIDADVKLQSIDRNLPNKHPNLDADVKLQSIDRNLPNRHPNRDADVKLQSIDRNLPNRHPNLDSDVKLQSIDRNLLNRHPNLDSDVKLQSIDRNLLNRHPNLDSDVKLQSIDRNLLNRHPNLDADVKLQSIDRNLPNRLPNVDASSVKKELAETTVMSHLGSVKTSRNIFNNSSKPSSQRDSTFTTTSAVPVTTERLTSAVPVTTERIKQFPSSTPTVSVSSSSSMKKASNTGQDPVGSSSSTADIKSGAVTSGISHTRSGSVKTPSAKLTEVKSTLYTRSGSIKDVSSKITTTESGPPSEPPAVSNKAETVSASKPDIPATSSAQLSSSPPTSALHASMTVAAQLNASLPSQTSSVTPLSCYIKPYNAYVPKTATISVSALRPANNALQPDIKNITTTTTTQTIFASNTNNSVTALNIINVKGTPISSIKPTASTPLTANTTTPATSTLPSVPSSSSLTTTNITTTSSSSPSTTSSSSRLSSVKPHSSFTTSAPFRPYISNKSSSYSTSTSSINKSPSFKAAPALIETAAPVEKASSIGKVTSNERAAADAKKPTSSARVPAWRTSIPSKEVKIEIIENSPSSAPPPASSSQTNSEILRKGLDKGKPFEAAKRTEGPSSVGAVLEAEKATRRSSKVLDMVKNFQNLQAPS